MRFFAFLAALAFVLAYVFYVFTWSVVIAISPTALLLAGLFFLTLHLAEADKALRSRFGRSG